MGAWSAEVFGNDAAGDWAYDVPEQGMDAVLSTLQRPLPQAVETEHSGCEVLAAAAVLARLAGADEEVTDDVPEQLETWVEQQRAAGVTVQPEWAAQALAVLQAVLGEDSELAELWEEDEEWTDSVTRLVDFLTPLAAA